VTAHSESRSNAPAPPGFGISVFKQTSTNSTASDSAKPRLCFCSDYLRRCRIISVN
jgi:hypothetical protein